MHIPLTHLELSSDRLAEIRTDITSRLTCVTQDMQTAACDALMESMSHLQYAAELAVLREMAAQTDRAFTVRLQAR